MASRTRISNNQEKDINAISAALVPGGNVEKRVDHFLSIYQKRRSNSPLLTILSADKFIVQKLFDNPSESYVKEATRAKAHLLKSDPTFSQNIWMEENGVDALTTLREVRHKLIDSKLYGSHSKPIGIFADKYYIPRLLHFADLILPPSIPIIGFPNENEGSKGTQVIEELITKVWDRGINSCSGDNNYERSRNYIVNYHPISKIRKPSIYGFIVNALGAAYVAKKALSGKN